jgi:aminoglycoside phosphotransferase (APT) family kinase protein
MEEHEQRIKGIIIKEFQAQALQINRITQGFSHFMYLVKIDKKPQEVIIRFSNNTKGEFNLSKERYVLEVLRENNLPVPRIFAFYFPEDHKEEGYMILEKINGTRLDIIWDSLNRKDKIQIAEEIGALASKIHGIKLSAFGKIEENGKISSDDQFKFRKQGQEIPYSDFLRNYLQGPLKDLARLLAYKRISSDFVCSLMKYVSDNIDIADYQSEPTLVHGDLHSGHIFVEKTEGEYRIVGLIDIEFASSLSPEYDFIKLHRTGFFDDKEIKSALDKGYGRVINEKAVQYHRVLRDMGFVQVMLDAGNNELAEKTLKSIEERIKWRKKD